MPKCKGSMRVTALIDDPAVIRGTLEHLGLGGAAGDATKSTVGFPGLAGARQPPLTDLPIPDIA